MSARANLMQRTVASLHPGKMMGPDGIIRSRKAEHQLNQMVLGACSTPAGRELLEYLKSISTNLVLGPASSDAELRDMEGRRFLVALIEGRLELGRKRLPAPDEALAAEENQ